MSVMKILLLNMLKCGRKERKERGKRKRKEKGYKPSYIDFFRPSPAL